MNSPAFGFSSDSGDGHGFNSGSGSGHGNYADSVHGSGCGSPYASLYDGRGNRDGSGHGLGSASTSWGSEPLKSIDIGSYTGLTICSGEGDFHGAGCCWGSGNGIDMFHVEEFI